MALTMDKFERLFSSSKRKEKAPQEAIPVIHPQLQSPSKPLFPSPSFIRPTSNSMKPREEERRVRNPDEKERSFSLSSSCHSRQPSISSATSRGRQRHTAPTGVAASYRPLESPRSPSPFRFPEDSLFKNVSAHRYSEPKPPVADSMELVKEECATEIGSDEQSEKISYAIEKGSYPMGEPISGSPKRPDGIRISVAPLDMSALLPSPIIMPSPISPTTATSVLGILDSLPPSPTRTHFNEKGQNSPWLPRLNRFSTLNLPHMESPSASDSEDEYSNCQFRSPASYATPNTFSTRESFDSAFQSEEFATSYKRQIRETWCARADDPFANDNQGLSPHLELHGSARSSTSWPSLSNYTPFEEDPVLREPTLDDFMALEDDEVAENYSVMYPDDAYRAPTPPPKDTPRIRNGSCASSVLSGFQKSASSCTVTASDDTRPPRPPKDMGTGLSGQHGSLPASALISTIATTFAFDEIYIMSFWPDDRRQRGILPESSPDSEVKLANASSHSQKAKVTGRLLGSYGLDEAVASWDLPTDLLAEALDTTESWYEYQDVAAGPQGLSHGFMCSFYGTCLPPSTNATPNMVNRGLVFGAFHTSSQPIITSGTTADRTELLRDLRSLAKLLVDETIRSL